MLLLEYWKPIPGFNRYEASWSGKIRSLLRIVRTPKMGFRWADPEFVKTSISQQGYEQAGAMEDNGTMRTKGVHVFVALAFHPNRHFLPEVNHLNGNKLDNNASNLEWTTRRGNLYHAKETGLWNPRRSKNKKQIINA